MGGFLWKLVFSAPSYINCLGNKIYVVLLEEDSFCSQYVTDKNSSCDKKEKCYYRNCSKLGVFLS